MKIIIIEDTSQTKKWHIRGRDHQAKCVASATLKHKIVQIYRSSSHLFKWEMEDHNLLGPLQNMPSPSNVHSTYLQ